MAYPGKLWVHNEFYSGRRQRVQAFVNQGSKPKRDLSRPKQHKVILDHPLHICCQVLIVRFSWTIIIGSGVQLGMGFPVGEGAAEQLCQVGQEPTQQSQLTELLTTFVNLEATETT